MLIKEVKYSYNDIAIIPAIQSNTEHRAEGNPYDMDGNLPIFTAPMSTVVNEENFALFEENKITPILPRNFSFEKRVEYLKRGKWATVSLQEFEELFINNDWNLDKYNANVLIDIANGHMSKLCALIYEAKLKYEFDYRLCIMAGNIANPMAYYELANAGCDACRMSIGTGEGCLTWTKLGVGYPIASLIDETYKIKKQLAHMGKNTPLIIADGGVRETRDVIKALALGADYVMIGGLFSKLVESAAPTFYYEKDGSIIDVNPFENEITEIGNNSFRIKNDVSNFIVDNLHKVFYGMASRRGQEDINGEKKKTSEGTEKVFDCTTNLHKWVKNMAEYIQSAMSYINCFNLEDINPERVDCCIVSQSTQESINK